MSEVRIIRPGDAPAYLGVGRRTRVLLDPATGHPGLELYEVEIVPGASSESHARPYPETLVVMAGVVGVQTRDTLHRAATGSVVLIPAGVEHQHTNAGDGTSRFLGIFAPPAGHADQVRTRRVVEEADS